jgi:hypothetical protein
MHDRRLKEEPVPGFGFSYRVAAQTLGTEWGRTLSPTIWIDAARDRLAKRAALGLSTYVPDVRFENEADVIRELGGVMWHVERPGIEPVAAHASEAGVTFRDGDTLIQNDAGLPNLQWRVVTALRSVPYPPIIEPNGHYIGLDFGTAHHPRVARMTVDESKITVTNPGEEGRARRLQAD